MNKLTTIGLFGVCACLAACGDSGEEAGAREQSVGRQSEDSMSAPDIELGGQFEVSAQAPFAYSSVQANLRCQDTFPGSPFHAIWTVEESSIAIKVSGFRDSDDSSVHRIDTFELSIEEDNRRRQAELTGATLSTVPIGSSGATTYYEVEASGTFKDGGTFTASGKCKA